MILYHRTARNFLFSSINPFTAKDAIWRPHGITHTNVLICAGWEKP